MLAFSRFFNLNLNIKSDNPIALSVESNYTLVMKYECIDTLYTNYDCRYSVCILPPWTK